MRSLLTLLLGVLGASLVLTLSGCDLSSSPSNSDDNPPPPPPPPGSPLLVRLEPSSRLLCPGNEIQLIGFNFSDVLLDNEATFINGQTRIPGLPIAVNVSPQESSQGHESTLRVVVPSGVATGNIELRVNGVPAGSIGFDACPQLMALTLGRNDNIVILPYQSLLGFQMDTSFVKLYGLNFTDLEEVILEDQNGQTQSISASSIERNVALPTNPPSGYQSIGVTLHDATNDIRLDVRGDRDNIKVRVRTLAGTSNALEIPCRAVGDYADPLTYEMGAVISAVKVPPGVRTGPVRIKYYVYDNAVNHSFKLEASWSLDGMTFRQARMDATDPENSGSSGILPGSFFHASRHGLFPGRGTIRTFTWDAQNDPLFLQENLAAGGRRFWTVHFRLHPVRESPNMARTPPKAGSETQHNVITPPIIYNFLDDKPGNDATAQRGGTVVESFQTRTNQDTRLSRDVFWGPPDNDDALSADIPTSSPSEFGSGLFDLVLDRVPVNEEEPGTVDQYVEINTDELTIIRKMVSDLNGTPCDPFDDIPSPGPTSIRNYDFLNPGAEADEFHLGTLTVLADVKVIVRGSNPLIFRLRGKGGNEGPEDPVLDIGPGVIFDMNGCPGGAGPRDTSGADLNVPGAGGLGGPGGGAGGTGATFDAGANPPRIVFAQDGANGGGRGGETTWAFDNLSANPAKSVGAPGGGGGHRAAGGAGSLPPTRIHAQFNNPVPGAGGPARGDGKQLVKTNGSGGGGGGACLVVDSMGINSTWVAGAGGGGGGGTLRVTANGAIVMDPTAKIQASGGAGGEGRLPPPIMGIMASGPAGPGGGGSGGTIVFQAAGPVNVACGSLEVFGGLHGAGANAQSPMNQVPGAGDGGAGWIRLESAVGGVPTCASLMAETTLTADLPANGKSIMVQSTAGFPDSGSVVIDAETIQYGRITATTFEVLTRPATPPPHTAGARVILKGAIFPAEPGVLADGKVTTSPDAIQPGRGRDGDLQLQFIPTVDPGTGQPHRDPETGQPLSIWIFDTAASQILKPDGTVFYETAQAEDQPGLLELTRLSIAPNTVLRAAGPNPLRISVTDQADIGGWIDASGVPGGFLRFDADEPTKPLPGVGGPGGAGGSRGGDGGTVEFANGNAGDKNPENTVPVNGGAGEAPPLTPDGLDETPGEIGTGSPDDGFAEGPSFTRATAGLSLRGQNCQTCEATAGGGGSGGNLRAGEDGQAHKGFDNQGQPIPNLDISGKAATAFGTDELRYGGDYWLLGGLSGSGGGGNPHVSDDYAQGRIPGSYRFKSSALYAPGTGGGGGGGAIHLVARNLTIRGSAKIRARGGNSYQSIDLGGNGGAGAGGTIFIQVQNALTLEPGAVIDVSGGLANLAPPTLGGQTVPEYPGNIRAVGGQTTNLGGIGGNGPPGRIRMEADSRSVALLTGANASVSSGPFYVSTVPGLAVSRALRVGVGDSGVASSHAMRLDTPNVLFFEFGQPAGTDSQVLWEGARDSLDQHAAVSPFEQGILDPRNLVNREFVRFQVPFLTNVALQRTQTLNEISLPFRLPSPTD